MDGQGSIHFKVPMLSLTMDLAIIIENYNVDIPKNSS